MIQLNKHTLTARSDDSHVSLPDASLLDLPEKVIQFGTGVLLRGLPNYFIDKANRQGIFNGRIVVVKSTDGGDSAAFDKQDGLYTIGIRGVDRGNIIEENIVCAAISRVLSAKSAWTDVLRCAENPDLQVVISNTTEVGIQLVQDDVRAQPPVSFPGKLLAFLYARYQAFEGDKTKGLVIVPTELIPNNGTKLSAILLELANQNGLEPAFIDWLQSANPCCNSLVDRIVPGRPDAATLDKLAEQLGYNDELLILAESFRLWAIEVPAGVSEAHIQDVLSFHEADEGVFIRPNIDLFRELKLRLLNGTHTLSCGLAYLSGFETVRGSMDDERLSTFISSLMLAELLPGIPYPVDDKVAQRFGMQVLDRFRNPYIEHRWLSISVQLTAKMQMRNIPTLLHYDKQLGVTPRYMALGFAGYLLFMRATHQEGSMWFGQLDGRDYPIQDDQAAYFANLWAQQSPEEVTVTVLQNKLLWGHDLTELPGFADRVSEYLNQLLTVGAYETVSTLFEKKGSTQSTANV